jgi:hypothetical protein
MESIFKRKFTTVFLLGYFISFLRVQLNDNQKDINEFLHYR